jgi:uncharacterized protein with PQ loop repeat
MDLKEISSLAFGICFFAILVLLIFKTLRIIFNKAHPRNAELPIWVKRIVVISLVIFVISMCLPIYFIVSRNYYDFGSSMFLPGFFAIPPYLIVRGNKKSKATETDNV